MFSNWWRWVFVLIDALVQVPARKTNITCITQVTFKMVHKGLLVNDWWLDFTWFQVSLNLVADENRLDGGVCFRAKIFQLRAKKISWSLVFEW